MCGLFFRVVLCCEVTLLSMYFILVNQYFVKLLKISLSLVTLWGILQDASTPWTELACGCTTLHLSCTQSQAVNVLMLSLHKPFTVLASNSYALSIFKFARKEKSLTDTSCKLVRFSSTCVHTVSLPKAKKAELILDSDYSFINWQHDVLLELPLRLITDQIAYQ